MTYNTTLNNRLVRLGQLYEARNEAQRLKETDRITREQYGAVRANVQAEIDDLLDDIGFIADRMSEK